MGVRAHLYQCVIRHYNTQYGIAGRCMEHYQQFKGLAGTNRLTSSVFSTQVRLTSGIGLTPEGHQKQTNLRKSKENTTRSVTNWQNKTSKPTTAFKYGYKSEQKYDADEPKLSPEGNKSHVHKRTSAEMQEYISEIVFGTHGNNGRGSAQRDGSKSKAKKDVRNLYDRNSNLPSPRTKPLQSSYIPKKYKEGTLEDLDDNETDFDDDNAGNLALERRRALFMEQSSEYTSTSVFEVIQTRMKSYRPDEDDVKVKLMTDSLINNETMSQDIVSEGIQSFCRLPTDKLHQYAGVELPLLLPKVVCKWTSTFNTDVFCDALLILVRLHCSLSPEEVQVLEEECLQRLRSWDLDSMLLVSDCWLCLDQHKLSYYKEMISVAADDLFYGTELTGQNIAQIFYIMAWSKTNPRRGVFLKLLHTLEKVLGDLTWLEVGIICFGLIKGAAPRIERSKWFLRALSKKVILGLQTDEIDMFSMIQILRYMGRSYHCDVKTFDVIAATLTPVIKKELKSPALKDTSNGTRVAHIAAAFAKARMYHKPLMDAIIEHVLQADRTNRTKDVNLLLWSFGRLNYKPAHSDQFFQYLLQTMQVKQHARFLHPEVFLGSLVSLTYLDCYPINLIDQAFSSAFLQICDEHIAKFGVNPICKQLFMLDCAVAVECPGYDGNRLSEHHIKMYEGVFHGSVHQTHVIEESGDSGDVIRLLRNMFGHKDFVKIHAILPHVKTPVDIEVHLDAQGNPVFPENFNSDRTLGPNLGNVAIPYYKLDQFVKETLEEKNLAGTQRLAILVTTPNHYHSNSPQLLGVHVMKRRQLRKVGYKIVEIPYFEWRHLSKENKEAKMNYLEKKLQNSS